MFVKEQSLSELLYAGEEHACFGVGQFRLHDDHVLINSKKRAGSLDIYSETIP